MQSCFTKSSLVVDSWWVLLWLPVVLRQRSWMISPDFHPVPKWQQHFHTCSNNLEHSTQSPMHHWTYSGVLPWPAGGHGQSNPNHCVHWTCSQCHHQRDIQHHEETVPIHQSPLDHSTWDHTLHHHEAPLVFCKQKWMSENVTNIYIQKISLSSYLSMTRIWSSVLMLGLNPPWTVKILSSMMADKLK